MGSFSKIFLIECFSDPTLLHSFSHVKWKVFAIANRFINYRWLIVNLESLREHEMEKSIAQLKFHATQSRSPVPIEMALGAVWNYRLMPNCERRDWHINCLSVKVAKQKGCKMFCDKRFVGVRLTVESPGRNLGNEKLVFCSFH